MIGPADGVPEAARPDFTTDGASSRRNLRKLGSYTGMPERGIPSGSSTQNRLFRTIVRRLSLSCYFPTRPGAGDGGVVVVMVVVVVVVVVRGN